MNDSTQSTSASTANGGQAGDRKKKPNISHVRRAYNNMRDAWRNGSWFTRLMMIVTGAFFVMFLCWAILSGPSMYALQPQLVGIVPKWLAGLSTQGSMLSSLGFTVSALTLGSSIDSDRRAAIVEELVDGDHPVTLNMTIESTRNLTVKDSQVTAKVIMGNPTFEGCTLQELMTANDVHGPDRTVPKRITVEESQQLVGVPG